MGGEEKAWVDQLFFSFFFSFPSVGVGMDVVVLPADDDRTHCEVEKERNKAHIFPVLGVQERCKKRLLFQGHGIPISCVQRVKL